MNVNGFLDEANYRGLSAESGALPDEIDEHVQCLKDFGINIL